MRKWKPIDWQKKKKRMGIRSKRDAKSEKGTERSAVGSKRNLVAATMAQNAARSEVNGDVGGTMEKMPMRRDLTQVVGTKSQSEGKMRRRGLLGRSISGTPVRGVDGQKTR